MIMKQSERVLDKSRPGVASCVPNVDDKWNPSVMKHRLERFVGFLAMTPRSKTHSTKVDGLDDPLLNERSLTTTSPYSAYSTYFRFLRRHDGCSGLFEDWFLFAIQPRRDAMSLGSSSSALFLNAQGPQKYDQHFEPNYNLYLSLVERPCP